jgi:predicted transcriptional regulator
MYPLSHTRKDKTMPQSMLEMAKDLVMAMIQTGTLAPEDMQKELQKTHSSLLELKSKEDVGDSNGAMGGTMIDAPGQDLGVFGLRQVDWKKSIKKYTIECLECGASFKQLSVRHLKNHDLDPRSYRVKYGIPRTQPLSAKDTTAARKRIVQQSRPWEKAPTYMKARSRKSANGAATKSSRTRRTTTADA